MKYLTKDEVADTLRVSVRTITEYMAKGLLPPPKRLGRRLLWNDAELLRWIEASSQRSTSAPTAPVSPKRGRPRKLTA